MIVIQEAALLGHAPRLGMAPRVQLARQEPSLH